MKKNMENRNRLLFLAVTISVYSTVFSDHGTGNGRAKRDVEDTILEIPLGTIRGIKVTTFEGRSISSFLGIPYAQPPTGDLRFKSPVASSAWTGILDATNGNRMCPQLSEDGVIGKEDCLYLNVYTPQISTDGSGMPRLLPVMVYIHGGGFEKGNAGPLSFGPEYLLDKDVVLVAPNYRLGVFGFLSTGDGVIPGNYGLKDIVLALKWVKKSIKHFGGNAEQVTLFGQSTGAGAVELLTLSNATDGLFHKYITESGSALSIRSFRPRESYVSRATELGEYLNCPTDTSTRLVDCLRQIKSSVIVNTKTSFYVWDKFPDIVWGPTDEPEAKDAIITKSPTSLYATADMRDLPGITGVVQDEGLLLTSRFYVNMELFESFLKQIDKILPHMLQYHKVVKDEKAFTKDLKAYYLNDLTANRYLLLANLTKLVGDSMFTFPVYSGLRQRLSFTKMEEYFYSFQYRGTFSYSYNYSGGSMDNYGVAHGDELLYLFPQSQPTREELGARMSKNDRQMIDTIVQLWTSFAVNGTPVTQKMVGFRKWRPHSIEDNYLQIGEKGRATTKSHYFFLSDRMAFWKEFNDTMQSDPSIFSKISSFVNDLIVYMQNIASKIFHWLIFWRE